MANAVATVSLPDNRYTWSDGRKLFVVGNVAISASPATYVTGGIPMSFNVPLVKATRAPIFVQVSDISGYDYSYIPGTTAANGLLRIYQQSAATGALTEIPAAAIPAGVSSDQIQVMAIFFGME